MVPSNEPARRCGHRNHPADDQPRLTLFVFGLLYRPGRTAKPLPLLQSDSLMTEKKPILVVAGILRRGDRILICQRPRTDAYGWQWEFPGGKVENGEELPAALRRELVEELGIQAEVGGEVFRLRHHYPDRFVEVVFFAIASYHGEVRNRVFEAIEWAPRLQLPQYNFLEADREMVNRLAKG